MGKIEIQPVGVVKVNGDKFSVLIDDKYKEALLEISGFSHINLIWWGDKADTKEYRDISVLDKPYKKGPGKIGVFSTRSQARPNPVLITPIEIISVDMDKGEIVTTFLDADDGTPVIDIKPYLPCIDRIKNVKQPEWCSSWPQYYEESYSFDWGSVFNF